MNIVQIKNDKGLQYTNKQESSHILCGIAFLHDPSSHPKLLISKLKQALTRLVHRGPDEQGICELDATVLGHRRLSIIDLATSKQPMTDPNSRYTLIYNGEIYNYKELRRQLSDQWAFRTKGDTEVLLARACLARAGVPCKAEGMWAFILWDSRDETHCSQRSNGKETPILFCPWQCVWCCV